VKTSKVYQRSNEDNKQTWWSHCDAKIGGVRDPNRHDVKALQQLISIRSVPSLSTSQVAIMPLSLLRPHGRQCCAIAVVGLVVVAVAS